MEIFKTTATRHDEEEFTFVSWGASKTEAAADRKRWNVDVPGCTVSTQTINIPTAKGPLVAWLNANVKG